MGESMPDRSQAQPSTHSPGFHRGAELSQEIWVAHLYGYRFERFDGGRLPGLAGPRLHLAVDTDPAARQRAAWMRAPDLRPGVPAPVLWGANQPGRWPLLWTPPGRPPGYGPILPDGQELPQVAIPPWRTHLSPGNLLRLALWVAAVRVLGGLGVNRAGVAVGPSWWDLLTAAVVAGLLIGALVARLVRDQAIRRAEPGPDPGPGPGYQG